MLGPYNPYAGISWEEFLDAAMAYLDPPGDQADGFKCLVLAHVELWRDVALELPRTLDSGESCGIGLLDFICHTVLPKLQACYKHAFDAEHPFQAGLTGKAAWFSALRERIVCVLLGSGIGQSPRQGPDPM